MPSANWGLYSQVQLLVFYWNVGGVRLGPCTRGGRGPLQGDGLRPCITGTRKQTDMAENITFATLLFLKRALRLNLLAAIIFGINRNNLRSIDFCDRLCRCCHFQRLFMFTWSAWLPTNTCTLTDLFSRIECIYRLWNQPIDNVREKITHGIKWEFSNLFSYLYVI